jgi:4-amino-4-deoxy-L-arabinose transferase-like glycosyltransferase
MRNILLPIFLVLIFIFHVTFNLIWIEKGYVPLSDEAYYMLHAVRIYKNFPKNFLSVALSIHPSRPTLFPLTALPFYLLFGPCLLSSIAAQSLYLAILLFSIYGIGRKIYDKNVGILAAFTVSMFPAIFVFSRLFYVEFALTALVTLSFYTLLLTDFFKKKKHSIYFGISLGLTALIKPSFIIFLCGPLFFIFLKIVKSKNKNRLINFIASIAMGILISSILYLPNFESILYWNIKSYTDPKIWAGGTNYLFNLFTYYSWIYFKIKQISFPFFFLFILSLVFISADFIKKKINKTKMIFISSLIFSFIFFIFLPLKFLRYDIPILPIISLFIVYPVFRLKKFRKIFIIMIVLIGFVTFLLEENFHMLFEARSYDTILKIRENEINEILELVKNPKKTVKVGLFNIQLSPTIELYAEIKNVPLTPIVVYEYDKPVYDTILETDYLIITDDWENGAISKGRFEETNEIVNMFKNTTSPIYNSFKQVGKISTVTGYILIFKKYS